MAFNGIGLSGELTCPRSEGSHIVLGVISKRWRGSAKMEGQERKTSEFVVSRRTVMSGLLLATASAKTVCATEGSFHRVETAVAALAAAMSAVHGGVCDVHVDHECGLVAVSMRPSSKVA